MRPLVSGPSAATSQSSLTGAPIFSAAHVVSKQDEKATDIPANEVSSKVQASFRISFGDITPQWSKTVKNNFLAEFSIYGRNTHALYTKNGYMLYNVIQGSASLLPALVRSLVTNAYADYDIVYATKATSLNLTAWITTLQLGKIFIIVKVINNRIVEENCYRSTPQ